MNIIHFYCYNTYLYEYEIFCISKQIEFNNISKFYDILSLSKYKNLNLSRYFEIITNEQVYIYLCITKLDYPNEIRDIILNYSKKEKYILHLHKYSN